MLVEQIKLCQLSIAEEALHFLPFWKVGNFQMKFARYTKRRMIEQFNSRYTEATTLDKRFVEAHSQRTKATHGG